MVITTRSGNSKKRPGMVDAPAIRRTHAEVQAAKKKKESEKKKKNAKKQKAQNDMNALEHNMTAAERERQKERLKKQPLANDAGGGSNASGQRSESPSPPASGRSSAANAKKPIKQTRNLKERLKGRPLANDAGGGASKAPGRPESPSPLDSSNAANAKKSLNDTRKRRKGQSTEQPRTPVPSRPSSSHRRNARPALTGDNEECSAASGDDEGEFTSAKRRRIAQSNVDQPSHSARRVSGAPVKKRRHGEKGVTAGR